MVKKIISALLLPLPFALLLAIVGLILILICHQSIIGKVLILLSLIITLAFSIPLLPAWMLNHLEGQYHPIDKVPQGIKTIVVLGAGNGGKKQYAANIKLSSASLARLIEGVRLHKLIPNSTLVLSGGSIFGSPADGDIMNNAATMLGVPKKDIKIEAGSQDTTQEAQNLKQQLGKAPFLLVTSGYHMPRAMAIFKHAGMHPIAAPTQLLIDQRRYSIKRYLPNSNALVYSDIAIHEYLGILWAKLTGKI